mmetsp:Transcript_8566/g.20940  ORF Transcript_8566/g.20940 Transcript_8566/m.20940 type:complete len:339 (+) Transcript_8566:245-1261(+)
MNIMLSSNYPAVLLAAVLLVVIASPQLEVDAFAPTTQTNSRCNARMKGREIDVLHSTVAMPEVAVAESTKTKSPKKRKQKSTKKGKLVIVKSLPKKNKSKGKASEINKSFKPLKDLKLGSKVSGTVVDVCDFGAFVNIGYATRGSRAGTALLHISQIQNKKISNIRDTIKVGDSIDGARVINIDVKKGEVGLSLRGRRPKRRDFTKLKVGDVLEGKVDSVVPYGVFVDVGANANALLHISRITGGSIENVRNHLNEGDSVSVHVIDIDNERKTVAVSMLDKKADQYLDRRMSQRLKRFYGSSASGKGAPEAEANGSSDLDYFDQAIRELEDALKGREE